MVRKENMETSLYRDDNFEILTKTEEDGSIVVEKMSDVKKELQQEKDAIDFLKGCPGLK